MDLYTEVNKIYTGCELNPLKPTFHKIEKPLQLNVTALNKCLFFKLLKVLYFDMNTR